MVVALPIKVSNKQAILDVVSGYGAEVNKTASMAS